ncbi:hypothetical protein BAUCODRAFT_60977, partial [Baudoinia panamericana UAMH 10762]
PQIGDIAARRSGADVFFALLNTLTPAIHDVETRDFHTPASDGHSLLCRWFTKKTDAPLRNSPAICYVHGGGMISASIHHFDQIIKNYVTRTGVPFLAVEYRLAPEVRAPVPVTDVYAGLTYLHSHAAELGVDAARIAIMGDSAGGGIAASLAHYVKLKGGPSVCKQILMYPMLDDRTTKEDNTNVASFASWTAEDNITGWTALLGPERIGTDAVTPVEAAGRMSVEDAKGLPPTYMDIGELDLFRDECLEYVRKLGKAGTSCEFHLLPGLPHGAEGLVPDSEVAGEIMGWRMRAIKSV